MLAIKINDVWTQWVGQPLPKADDPQGETFQLSLAIEQAWNDEALAIWGLKRVIEFAIPSSPDPDGRAVTSLSIVEAEDGTLTQVPSWREPTEQDLLVAKRNMTYGIVALLNQVVSPITLYYPEAEKTGWVAKETEARAYAALGDSPDLSVAPLLAGLAAAQNPDGPSDEVTRKAQVGALSQIVIAKADAFRVTSVTVEGVRTKYQNLVDKAITIAEVNKIRTELDAELVKLSQLIQASV